MWQADTFDPATIDRELGWAEGIGMNTMRVFLHNLLWEQDPAGLSSSASTRSSPSPRTTTSAPCSSSSIPAGIPTQNWARSIRPFPACTTPAGCRRPEPRSCRPRPVPAPRRNTSRVSSAHSPTTRAFSPGISGTSPTTATMAPTSTENQHNKNEIMQRFCRRYSRGRALPIPSQPLTSGVWHGDWTSARYDDSHRHISRSTSPTSSASTTTAGPRTSKPRQDARSNSIARSSARNTWPVAIGSTFDTILPIAKQYHVGAINWGLVAGKSQTYLPWDSWQRPYVQNSPRVW